MSLIQKESDLHNAMREWRRDIHAHPETAIEEHRTAAKVAELLKDFGLNVTTGLAGTGVVATLEGSQWSEHSIGLRADLDTLNLQEGKTFPHCSRHAGKMHGWQTYKQGVLTNVFNPKVALFFLAFLPQFIDSSYAYGMLSFLMLGITFAVTGFIWFSCLSLLSLGFSNSLREKPFIETLLNKISGVIFFGLGIKLLTEKG